MRSSQLERVEALKAARDRLAADLRGRRVPGVISVGLTKGRTDGAPTLLVAVKPSFRGQLPAKFEGISVVTREFEEAGAHSVEGRRRD
jgi:hypothetical protein